MQADRWKPIAPLRWRGWRYGIVLALTVAIALMAHGGTAALAQDAKPASGLAIANPFAASGQLGNIVYAPVELDGRKLFQIAAEAATGTESTGGESPIQMRVTIYETKLNWVVGAGFDADTLEVNPGNRDGKTVINVADGDRLPKMDIVSLTELDARLHGVSEAELAKQLSEIIQPALIRAQLERQPEYLRSRGAIAGAILLGASAIGFILRRSQHQLKQRWDSLAQNPPLDPQLLPNATPVPSDRVPSEARQSELFALQEQQIQWERQRDVNALKRRLLQVGQFLLWLGVLAGIAGLFPYTRWLQNWLLTKPLVLLILLLTSFAIKLSDVAIDRCFNTWIETQLHAPKSSKRLSLRFSTFSHVFKGITACAIAALGLLFVLYQLHVPIAPVLAGAGIVGFAVSFASQNLLRDAINGTLILLEDQYAIGDFIDVGGASGLVEYMNLRITQVRGRSGRLTTIPHSSITTVHNLSKDWSRLDFAVEVNHDADLTKALQVVKEVAEKLHQDPQWRDRIIDPVNLLGVNNITHTGIEIAIWIKTQPGQHWSVGQEFRNRLKRAFNEAEIEIGIPQGTFWVESDRA